MQFEVPAVINEDVSKEYWQVKYPGEPLKASLAHRVCRNVRMRIRLAEAQNWRCCWCGCKTVTESNKGNSATVEHVTPRSLGGSNNWHNLAMSCGRCNQKRGTKSVKEFMAWVAHHPNGQIKKKKRDKPLCAAQSVSRQQLVRNAIADGNGNTFDPDSKEYKMFERYVASVNLNAHSKAINRYGYLEVENCAVTG